MPNDKKLCALHGVHVNISEHNDYGKCACLDCMGCHCHSCKEFKKLSMEILMTLGRTRCELCKGYTR